MRKTLVGLFVPALQQRFDLLVPPDMEIKTLIGLACSGVSELVGGRYTPSGDSFLCVREPELLLNPAHTLADYGLGDGAQLVLI